MKKNCWGCGQVLERVTDQPLVVQAKSYCGPRCVEGVDDPSYPIDYDAQDCRAAAEERIENHRRER